MAEQLKPCPFCGECYELYPSHHWPGSGPPFAIDCVGCGIDFTPREGMDVIAAWNRRSDPKPEQTEEEQIKSWKT